MAMTGPETSSIAFSVASFGRHPLLDVMLHGLDHHDGVVHHQADGQHQAEERQRVDGKAQQREDGERPTSETGTASSGISAARQPCRKMNTTSITSASASQKVLPISRMPSVTALVVSIVIW